MIAHKLRTIFLHIPKTAGSSIEVALDTVEKTNAGAIDPATGKHDPVTTKPEKHYDAVACKENYGENVWANYFKFTVVRNPWDRLHSIWWNMQTVGKQHSLPFGEYVQSQLKPPLYRRMAGTVLRRYARPKNMRPQVDLMRSSDGSIEIDYVCRFENIDNDFAEVCDKIGLEVDSLPRVLYEKRRPASRHHYVEDYDNKSTKLVEEIYRDDVELFSYKFGD